MESKPFDNVKNQIGSCGLWCGSCIVGNGTLKALTKRYEQLIKGYGVDQWGATNFDSEEFMKGLTSIQALPVCRGCRKGGGNEECKIRPCAANKKSPDCIECGEMKTCGNHEVIEKVRTGAFSVGMLAKTEKGKTPIGKWTAQIKKRFPDIVIEI